jgi:hypothetical protein
MATKTWNVTSMSTQPTQGELTNVVLTVFWRCAASSGNFVVESVGNTQVLPVNPADFIQYSDLTEAETLKWVTDILGPQGVADIEAGVDQKLQDAMNPPAVVLALPWASA